MIYIYRYTYIHYIPFHCIALQYITFAFTLNICLYIYTNWWFQPPLKKYESQIGSSSQLLGKIKNSMVPNHQPLYIYICVVMKTRFFSMEICCASPFHWRHISVLIHVGQQPQVAQGYPDFHLHGESR